jgi:hypothetical protein
MVIVGDDCALPPPRGIAGRRGLAGTILVHKVLQCCYIGVLILDHVNMHCGNYYSLRSEISVGDFSTKSPTLISDRRE